MTNNAIKRPRKRRKSQLARETHEFMAVKVRKLAKFDDLNSGPLSSGEVEAVPATGALPASEQFVEISEEPTGERHGVVKSAALNMLGNLGSSIMGMVRSMVLSATGASTAGTFFTAFKIPQTFNDFIVNGSVPGALIPTFNDYARPEKHQEMRRVIYTVVNLVLLIMIGSALGFFFVAPWFVNLIASSYTPAERELTTQLARILSLVPLLLGPFAVLQAALYARKEFKLTAFATAAAHVGIIIGALATFWNPPLIPYGLAFGALLGAAGEIALLLPGLYKERLGYMFVLDLRHPAFRQILKLYGPVSISFLASTIMVYVDIALATSASCPSYIHEATCGTRNYSAMQLATNLIQFPGGLVAAALSFAVLPVLTTFIREGQIEQFKSTLAMGIRLGFLLMVPAAAGIIVLQWPIVLLLFKRGGQTIEDAHMIASALQNYAYQLPFLALDQLLIAAFYSRKNTIIPVSVLFVGIAGYLAVALPFAHTLGVPALAFANTVQNSVHAIVLLILLRLAIGSMHLSKLVPALLKIGIATVAMVLVSLGLLYAFNYVPFFSLNSWYGQLLTVIVVGGCAAATYFGAILLLKVEEIHMLKGAVMAKLGKR
jgi:putative peptidoglycan lipid II flippase